MTRWPCTSPPSTCGSAYRNSSHAVSTQTRSASVHGVGHARRRTRRRAARGGRSPCPAGRRPAPAAPVRASVRVTASAGESRTSSVPGLKRGAQHRDPQPGQVRAGRAVRAAEQLGGELDDPAAAALVDQVDLVQEAQRLAGAELLRPGLERADVLGQAGAAEADAGAEELLADPVVVADRPGELADVGAGGLADLGHRVDEGDLGGQEGVRGHLDQLGGGEVGDHDRHLAVLGHGEVEDALVRGEEHRVRPRALHAEDQAVGAQHVLDGEALLQELRAPGDLDAEVGRGVLLDQLLDPLGRADRHGRLADDERLAGQMRHQRGDRRLHVAQVGAQAVAALRGADADEVHVAELGRLAVVGGEAQPPGGQVAAQHLVQAGLVDGHLAGGRAWRSWLRRRRSRAPRSRARRSRWRRSRRGSPCR